MSRIKAKKPTSISLYNKTFKDQHKSLKEQEIIKDLEYSYTFNGYPIPIISFNREMKRI